MALTVADPATAGPPPAVAPTATVPASAVHAAPTPAPTSSSPASPLEPSRLPGISCAATASVTASEGLLAPLPGIPTPPPASATEPVVALKPEALPSTRVSESPCGPRSASPAPPATPPRAQGRVHVSLLSGSSDASAQGRFTCSPSYARTDGVATAGRPEDLQLKYIVATAGMWTHSTSKLQGASYRQ